MFYWKRGFPQLGGNKSIGPILTRLETFLSPKPIRYMVSQRGNKLNFVDMMDRGKIFLAKLPQGQMGKETSHLLGSLIVSKLQQMVMSRQRMVALITCDERRRSQLAAAVEHFAPDQRSKIQCFSPDEFIVDLEMLPDLKPDPASLTSKTIQGWKVKRKFAILTPEEKAAKSKAAFDLLGQEMKLPPAE